MREILFRGKQMDNGRWVYGDYHKFTCTTSSITPVPTHYIMGTDASSKAQIWVDPTTVGQYTGLQDKNGKKIFEGDIVKFEYPSRDFMNDYVVNGTFSFTGIVVFEDCYFALKKKRANLGYDYLQLNQARAKRDFHDGIIEIIGNIHDNPELLEE